MQYRERLHGELEHVSSQLLTKLCEQALVDSIYAFLDARCSMRRSNAKGSRYAYGRVLLLLSFLVAMVVYYLYLKQQKGEFLEITYLLSLPSVSFTQFVVSMLITSVVRSTLPFRASRTLLASSTNWLIWFLSLILRKKTVCD